MSIKKHADELKNRKNEIAGRLTAVTQIELTSDFEALIEGCKSILEYDDNLIRIGAKRFEIRFTGENLTLRSINEECIAIEGKISGVEFIR